MVLVDPTHEDLLERMPTVRRAHAVQRKMLRILLALRPDRRGLAPPSALRTQAGLGRYRRWQHNARRLREDFHADLVTLSDRGRHITALDSGRQVHLDQPDVIVDAVLGLRRP